MKSTSCDVLIAGGGTGGCAAAMALTSLGFKVIMTEEYPWIGGQLTSQAVPPDEHPWIEDFGCTARYRQFRNGVRQYYRDHMPLTPEAMANPQLNPGGGWVSRLCYEPRIGWLVLKQMLASALDSGLLTLRLPYWPISAETSGDTVHAVVIENLHTCEQERIEAKYVLDATELGDLLPMTGTEYVSGAESKQETGEPNAVEGPAQPDNVQGFTWVMALGYDPEGDHTINKPTPYDWWREYRPSFWPGNLFGFKILNVKTLEPVDFPLFPENPADPMAWFNIFEYRQIVKPSNFEPGAAPFPVTIMNWPQNDFFRANIIDKPAEFSSERLIDSQQLSLSFLYWLQTEAGYPGLHPRPDIVGWIPNVPQPYFMHQGLAQAPYIRESRRIQARFTVLEQHVAAYTNEGRDRAMPFKDSVGVGAYRIDLHPSASGANTIDTSTVPFQIPLGSLIPVRMQNLLPACKNLGVTHITNGCYRLHPVEWNIGESAGLLAGFCLRSQVTPAQVWESPALTSELQELCRSQGIELEWPDTPLHAL